MAESDNTRRLYRQHNSCSLVSNTIHGSDAGAFPELQLFASETKGTGPGSEAGLGEASAKVIRHHLGNEMF